MSSNFNVEKVVNAPRNPVPKSKSKVSFAFAPVMMPNINAPNKFTVIVPKGSDSCLFKTLAMANREIAPRKPPIPTYTKCINKSNQPPYCL